MLVARGVAHIFFVMTVLDGSRVDLPLNARGSRCSGLVGGTAPHVLSNTIFAKALSTAHGTTEFPSMKSLVV